MCESGIPANRVGIIELTRPQALHGRHPALPENGHHFAAHLFTTVQYPIVRGRLVRDALQNCPVTADNINQASEPVSIHQGGGMAYPRQGAPRDCHAAGPEGATACPRRPRLSRFRGDRYCFLPSGRTCRWTDCRSRHSHHDRRACDAEASRTELSCPAVVAGDAQKACGAQTFRRAVTEPDASSRARLGQRHARLGPPVRHVLRVPNRGPHSAGPTGSAAQGTTEVGRSAR